MTEKALILLEDGKYFTGTPFGARGTATGELVFNTSMTGYQEVLTDPSYKGQVVTMTYPLIGNYGVNDEDLESPRPQVEGFVVRECCRYPSNWRTTASLDEYLAEHGIVGIEGVDTRAVTRHIRSLGAMMCIVSSEDADLASLKARLDAAPGYVGVDLVAEVTCGEPYRWEDPRIPPMGRGVLPDVSGGGERPLRVVAYDCGIKRNILRILSHLGCEVVVVPANTPASRVLGMGPDGIFLSNGPGDPAAVTYLIEEVAKLVGVKPIFGICLGHQILGLALGGRTFKLKFGHRGANQPVKDLRRGNILITAQNHGFCVDLSAVERDTEPTFINLNDGTLEGFRHRRYPAYSVQFHPEDSPGPHDAVYLFGDFIRDMRAARGEGRA
ncbi:MAG: glutamine-hydrolyzing carbamoyl-phosphate synthase small subunit [Actinobacteria bacterium]|nr:glutamine-hydrolyzing carbamoyl-phosphate synthase small subunit [Actinomycetota bacterium]MDI6831143.1 glutamine-hydrolyzing carbamoyl-phosphate synthase small subunit [Actinomycetota bacterium]